MRKAVLNRVFDDGVQILGNILLMDDADIVGEFKTLELAWKNNSIGVSAIPKGWYNVVPYKSPSKGDVYLLEHVYNRTFVEIHAGNYHTQIQGCILVGEEYLRINDDNLYDMTNSKKSLSEFIKAFNYKEFLLIIQ